MMRLCLMTPQQTRLELVTVSCQSRIDDPSLIASSYARFLLVLAISIVFHRVGLAQQRPAPIRCTATNLVLREKQFQNLTIRTFTAEPFKAGGCVEILRDGVRIFARHFEGRIQLAQASDSQEQRSTTYISAGTDITGLGKPNLIIDEYTGGAHCCTIFHVLEIGDSVREVAVVNVQDAGDSRFIDLDADGIYEIESRDFTFAYWQTSFAKSPAARIVLRFNGRSYEPALTLMREPAPSEIEYRKLVRQVRRFFGSPEYKEFGYVPPLLWRVMLNLIYSGHPKLAWKFAVDAWPPITKASQSPFLPSRSAFLSEFCGQLASSFVFPALRPTLTNAPCVFDPRKRKRM